MCLFAQPCTNNYFVIRFEIFLINKEYWELRVQVQLAVELE